MASAGSRARTQLVTALNATRIAASAAMRGVRSLGSAISDMVDPRVVGMAALAAGLTIVGIAGATAKGAIDAMIARERQLRGLNIITGSMDEALRQRARFRDLSDFLGISPGQVADGMTELLTKGFSEVESVRIMQGMADIGTLTPNFDPSRVILAISQIRQAGVLQGDELRQLQEAGLPLEHVYERIGAAMGIAANEVKNQRGTIPAAIAIQGVLQGIQDLTGSSLGTVARQASQGLGGQLARLQQAPERFFASLADMSGPLSGRMTEVLARLNAFFDPATPESQAMMEGVLSAIEGIMDLVSAGIPKVEEFVSWLRDPVTQVQMRVLWIQTQRFFDMIGTGVSFAIDMWNRLSGPIGGLMGIISHMLLFIGGQFDAWVARPVAAMTNMFGVIRDLFTGNFASWREIGSRLVEGLALGISDMAGAPFNAVENIATNMVGIAQDVLGIRSPSRVFQEIGMYTAEGFALGVEGGRTPGLSLPGVDATSDAGKSPFGRGGNTFYFTLNVDATGNPSGESIARDIRAELISIFDGTALEGGS